jgi:hypothetical protein
MALPPAAGEALKVQSGVDGRCERPLRPICEPQVGEATEILATALRAWAMPCRQRGSVVEEEQLRVPPGLIQGATAVLERKPARNPRPAGVVAAHATCVIVQASTIPEDHVGTTSVRAAPSATPPRTPDHPGLD